MLESVLVELKVCPLASNYCFNVSVTIFSSRVKYVPLFGEKSLVSVSRPRVTSLLTVCH